MTSADAGHRRMRTLSALLDDNWNEEDQLPEVCHDLFALVTAAPSTHPKDEQAAQREQTRRNEYLCIECQAHDSALFCEQCHDYFCELCYSGQHRKGNRRTHTFQPRLPISTTKAEDLDTVTRPNTTERVDNNSHEDTMESKTSSDEDRDLHGLNDSHSPADANEPVGRQTLCNLMGHYLLGYPSSTQGVKRLANDPERAAEMLARAKFIPVRLTYEERKLLRVLEAALSVSSYTDKLDTRTYLPPGKRIRAQLQNVCGFLSALAVALNYKAGQTILDDKNFAESAFMYQELFELGRRYKIMNPEKMRSEYGKLMYLLQDAVSPELQELLGFSCMKKIRTVFDVLETGDALEMLTDSRLDVATMVVAPKGKSRHQIQRQIKQKELAIRALSDQYESSRLSRETLQQCLYSIADNKYHLYFERDPIDRIIHLLTTHFHPEDENQDTSLAITSGNDGARLSHSHSRQYHYVLQSLTLWREIAHDLFRLWYLTDEDLLANGTQYELTETGQGLHRIQSAPRVSRAMHMLLYSTQRTLDSWVGSSVIHLGDKNVPNALMFIDKYTQVGHILRPVINAIDTIESLCESSEAIQKYVETTFGGFVKLQRTILADFFREAFDGSGADNFFDAGSCIDGRLTSAWNWCSNLSTKSFFPIFKLTGFVGFDGKFE